MARIAGIDIPREKRVEVALTYIFGIGLPTSQKILAQANVNPDTRVRDLTEEQRAAYLEELHALRNDPKVELWYGDECGVGGDPRPRRRWSARGSRPRVPYLGDHLRARTPEGRKKEQMLRAITHIIGLDKKGQIAGLF